MNILFVCTGNTCRSPMAEGIFKDMLKENNITHISVYSAGISAFPGEGANEKSIKALRVNGIDISGHKAKQLTDLIDKATIILTMTLSHKMIIEGYYADKLKNIKVFTLKEFAALVSGQAIHSLNIEDPYGMSYNMYEKTRDEIEGELNKILKNIDKIDKLEE